MSRSGAILKRIPFAEISLDEFKEIIKAAQTLGWNLEKLSPVKGIYYSRATKRYSIMLMTKMDTSILGYINCELDEFEEFVKLISGLHSGSTRYKIDSEERNNSFRFTIEKALRQRSPAIDPSGSSSYFPDMTRKYYNF